ncbi:endonuclease-reverse transcriptase [Elysia marginata]|uniref:Endonuclease-reverse transcriptase n=1 Tax=Elysia marginata TaxID=1093978 RepID=A0AAV4GDM0_9GAST|nr:endonuclease-reverse transcriptase [Elysia marginata]
MRPLLLLLRATRPTQTMQILVIEKSNEYNLPLCAGFIDYEKAFDSVEHFAIFDALRQIHINEKYVNILENIYQNATAKVHIDNMESELFPITRGVRQVDPISPKLFTAAIEMIFRKAELKHCLNIDGETLTNLRFADDVALVTEDTKSMEEQLNNLNKISLESGLKMHKVVVVVVAVAEVVVVVVVVIVVVVVVEKVVVEVVVVVVAVT